jgi:hypothetical protein
MFFASNDIWLKSIAEAFPLRDSINEPTHCPCWRLHVPGAFRGTTGALLAYGGVHFASKVGQLAGNHFITLTSGLENLPELGKTVLWKGAQKVRFEAA